MNNLKILILASLPLAILAGGIALASSTIYLNQGGTGWSTSTPCELLVGTSSAIQYSRLPCGSSGMVLQSTGSALRYAATSSLGIPASQWNNGASGSIYYLPGNVEIGTTTPTAFGISVQATSTPVALSGTSYFNYDFSMNGSGTHYMSQLHVGDIVESAYSPTIRDVVVRVVSDTLAYVERNNFYNNYGTVSSVISAYPRLAGFTSADGLYSAGITNSQSVPAFNGNGRQGIGMILNADTTEIANSIQGGGGIVFDSVANDGRIYMHQSNTAVNQGSIEFWGGNSEMTITGANIVNSTFQVPLYLGAQSFGGNVNSIYIGKSGDGAGQTMYLSTMSYAGADGHAPSLQVAGNGIGFATRPAFWNSPITGTTTLAMLPTGEWSLDSATASTSPFSVYGFASQQAPLTTWLNSSSSTLAVMSASGFLGLGTSTPSVSLTVASSTGSATLSADAATGKVNVSNLPRGTTGFPPSGLVTGDLWWDTTTNLINIKP